MSRLDIVVFGATGFTGKHVVRELAPIAKQRGLSWGVAGRSQEKLQAVLKEAGERTGEDLSAIKSIIADVHNEESLRAMCGQARVVISCCGPYLLLGESLVRAAIQSGTHYVDCSGEPNFIELMQLKYDQEARKAGVYVVSACAFESIPVDLGVLFLQENFEGVLNSVECYLSTSQNSGSSINSGTWNTLVYSMPHFLQLPALRKKVYPEPLPKFEPKLKYRLIHKRFNNWCVPFPGNDASAVYRTQRYLYEAYRKRPVQIKTYASFPSLVTTIAIVLMVAVVFMLSYFKATRWLLTRYSGVFSGGVVAEGPSEAATKATGFKFTFCGVGWASEEQVDTLPPNKTVEARVSGTNPGYGMTVMGLIFSAVAILKEQDKMPAGGGVLSPGTAFHNTQLVKNLQENGLNFEIISKDKNE